jgi:hypothetical protein
MAKFAIVIGILLTLLGLGFYGGLTVAEDASPSPTALIPALAGVPILLLGLVALRPSIRKHAMHGVAALALLGCVLPIGHLSRKLAQGAEVKTTALVAMVTMAALCSILLIACVRSFVRARLTRAN